MKRILKIVFALLISAFIIIQFFRPDFSNPSVIAEKTLQANVQVPENVQAIINRSCRDCHSNETVYPWYSKIQPAAQFLANHIKDGRHELNFSEWSTFSPRKQKRKLEQICEQIESREMPLPSYLWIHRDAQMTDADIKILCDWANAESAKIPDQPQ